MLGGVVVARLGAIVGAASTVLELGIELGGWLACVLGDWLGTLLGTRLGALLGDALKCTTSTDASVAAVVGSALG